jgi:glucosamine kinase
MDRPLHVKLETLSQAPRFHIGVDGGGTGTRLRLAEAGGAEIGFGEAGPSALGQGVEQAWRHVLQALDQAFAAARIARPSLADCALGLGLSGAAMPEQAQAFLSSQPGFAHVVLDNDGFTSVLGAHGGRPGAVLAAGTGTVGEALRHDGTRAMVSGWGWINGDEGSGAWLGLKAMRYAQQALDGRVPASPLARTLWAIAGADRPSMLAWCAAAGQHGHAQLARQVFDLEAADPVAAGLIDEARLELERLAAALDPEESLPMAITGSIARRLAPRFAPALRERCVEPEGDSAAGALLLLRLMLAKAGDA